MPMPSVAVLFTGQVRDPALFAQSLAELGQQDCVNELIFSTWHDEAVRHIDFLDRMRREHGLTVVASADPMLSCDRFNGFRQSLTLRRGLEAVRDASHVFKTRTDCHMEAAVLPHLAGKERRISDPWALSLRVFREKVSVVSCSVIAPFYIDDKVLFGHREDLYKLCSLDFGEYRLPYSAKYAHYVRFYPPFRAHFPQFADYLPAELFVTIANPELRPHILPLTLERREFALMILVYHRIIHHFFCLDWGGFPLRFKTAATAVGKGGEAGFRVEAEQMVDSNAFFAQSARGEFENAELARLLRPAAEAIRYVPDLRDAGSGIDYRAFFGEVRREGKRLLQFEVKLNEAKNLIRDGDVLEAFGLLTQLLPTEHTNQEVLHLIAMCYSMAGDQRAAIGTLERCLDAGATLDSLPGQLLVQLKQGQIAGPPPQ